MIFFNLLYHLYYKITIYCTYFNKYLFRLYLIIFY
nr:MAG TPA: hypothetical protein [Caudoviricetes sp.]